MSVTTAQGDTLAGTFSSYGEETLLTNFVFVPELPLSPGEYFVRAPSGDLKSFSVVTEEVTPPEIEVRFETYLVEQERITCNESEDALSLLVRERHTAWLHFVPTGLSASQYWYSYEVDGEPTGTQQFFDTERSEICYQVFATSLLTGEKMKIADDCYSEPNLATVGIHGIDSEERRDFLTVECVVPPTELLIEWCDLFNAAFVAGDCDATGYSDVDPCESARRLCPDGDLYVPGSGDGMGGIMADEPDKSQDVVGCACQAGSSPPRRLPSTTLFVALGLAWARCCRRSSKNAA